MADVKLRALTMEDAPLIYEITSDPKAAKYMRFDTHTSLSQAEALVERYLRPGNYAFAMEEPQTGEFVGYFTMSPDEDGCYGMSTMLLPRFWNHGFASATLAHAKAIANDPESPVRALEAYVVGDNGGSRRVLEKNDFSIVRKMEFEGLPSGLYIYRYENPDKK